MAKFYKDRNFQRVDANAIRFAQENIILDRANTILEAHRGILPPMSWQEALAQARREQAPTHRHPQRKPYLFGARN